MVHLWCVFLCRVHCTVSCLCLLRFSSISRWVNMNQGALLVTIATKVSRQSKCLWPWGKDLWFFHIWGSWAGQIMTSAISVWVCEWIPREHEFFFFFFPPHSCNIMCLKGMSEAGERVILLCYSAPWPWWESAGIGGKCIRRCWRVCVRACVCKWKVLCDNCISHCIVLWCVVNCNHLLHSGIMIFNNSYT